eukprot:gene11214-12391_t
MTGNHSQKLCLFLHELEVPDNVAIKATAIVTAILGTIVAIGAVIGNSIIIFVLIKFERLQIPSNLLLGSLCVTDLLTGLVVQPLSMIRRVNEAHNKHVCTVRLVCAYFAFLCVVASIINVCMISIDRYFAITMPFWYQRRVSNAKYCILIVCFWLLIAGFALLPFAGVLTAISFFQITFALMGLTIVMFLVAYSRIAVIVRNHQRRIHPHRHRNHHHQQQELPSDVTIPVEATTTTGNATKTNGVTSYMSRERKKAYTIAIIVSFALVSYLPLAVMFILRGVMGDTIELVCIADTWADFILHFNSVVNPVIYCFRSEEIRLSVKRIMPSKLMHFGIWLTTKADKAETTITVRAQVTQ